MNAVVNDGAIVPYSDIRAMAKTIAESNLFGVKKESEVLALMLVAQAEGRHPASVARDYDIVSGKPAKKAEAMLRDFIVNGGKVEWHKLDDTIADATFSHPAGGTVRIAWDMARAKTAELSGKAMYGKYPRQMLRSRTISEGVRTVFPAATGGLYVPEEIRTLSAVPSNGATIEGQSEDVTPPDGYVDWRADMTAVADEGTAKLQDTWKASDRALREYVVKHDAAWWDETKAKAAQVQS